MAENGLEKELAEYVSYRRRVGKPDYRMSDALLEHRRMALSNLRASEDVFWAERLKALDRLADKLSIPLANEEQLRFVLDEIAERERKRRAEDIARRKAEHVEEQETLT